MRNRSKNRLRIEIPSLLIYVFGGGEGTPYSIVSGADYIMNFHAFYKTNLDEILHEKGIKTVVVTGFAANGAVLHTATSAAFHDYNVIVPVDCMSTANILYAEQYTAWHMLNSPGTRNRAVLTKVDLINFLH